MTDPGRMKLIERVGACVTDFGPAGPKTLDEFNARGEERCPYYGRCSTPGFLDRQSGVQCAMRYGQEVAQMALRQGRSLTSVMHSFRFQRPDPPKGFVWSPDRKRFEIVTDFDEAADKIEEFARMALDLGLPIFELTTSIATPEPDTALSEEEIKRRDGGGFRFL